MSNESIILSVFIICNVIYGTIKKNEVGCCFDLINQLSSESSALFVLASSQKDIPADTPADIADAISNIPERVLSLSRKMPENSSAAVTSHSAVFIILPQIFLFLSFLFFPLSTKHPLLPFFCNYILPLFQICINGCSVRICGSICMLLLFLN